MDEGRRIILADGTEIAGDAGYSDGFLWCFLKDCTMIQAAAVFMDPEKIAVIIYRYGEMQDTYEGFTVCRVLSADADGKVSVCMEKARNA